jgi:hypothetical protein
MIDIKKGMAYRHVFFLGFWKLWQRNRDAYLQDSVAAGPYRALAR